MKLWWLFFTLSFITSCTPKHETNHLNKERSLYLRNSKSDAIWWYPWGQQPLNYAKKNSRLIFLSIGYASCFACEKMHTEIYSDSTVSKKLNDHFVSIQIDREERPDLDAHFLNLQTAIMKFGAWPINIILTPDLKPVYATTYIKKHDFLKLLSQVQQAWQKNPNKIINDSSAFLKKIKPIEEQESEFSKDKELIKDFYARYTHRFDTLYGGIRTGRNFFPKFPVSDDMRLLLRYHLQTGDPQPLKMVKKTLATIAKSAMFDQLEGGFHRYSSSRDWNTPNFEKMLIDQAGFINAYTELNLFKENNLYSHTLEKTVNFLLKNFSNPLGGFYSSQSGSLLQQNGRYYTWQFHEIQSALSKELQKTFNEYFSLTAPQTQYQQRRSLRSKTSFRRPDLSLVTEALTQSKYKSQKPVIDKKVVTSTNAYFLSSLIKLAKTWPSDEFESVIQKNLDFLLRQHRTVNGNLLRRSINGETKFQAILDDYAYLIDALIEFYQLSHQEKYLIKARQLQTKQDQYFYNQNKNLYRYNILSPELPEDQFLFKDQAQPSGQSMTFWNLIRLSRYFYNSEMEDKAIKMLEAYPDQLKNDPLSYASLLIALDFEISNPKNLIISSSKKDCKQYAKKWFNRFFPYALISCADKYSKIPLHKNKEKTSQTLFYLCDRNSCLPPIDSFDEVTRTLLSSTK